MIIIDSKNFLFPVKQVWFSDDLFDLKGCAEVVFICCKDKHEGKDFTFSEEYTTLIIDLTSDLDKIWQNMNRKYCRAAIRRAERNGVKIKINQKYNEFYELYRSFRRTKNGLGRIDDLSTIRKYGTLFIAEKDDELLVAHVYLEDKGMMVYWLTASNRPNVDKERKTLIGNASRLLHWEAIKYAKAKGLTEFDIGNISADGSSSQDRFKKSFGGEESIRYRYAKDYSRSYALCRDLYISYVKFRNYIS